MTDERTTRASLRTWLLRMTALGVGGLLAIILAEGAIRLFRLAPSGGLVSVTEREFSRIPGIFSPNRQLTDRQKPDLPHLITINSLGYRGSDFSVAKPSDELRVFMAGDSFTFGDFVDDDESVPAYLEKELRGRCGNVRVINAGVGGLTIVGAQMMVARGLPLSPDIIVLTHSENNEVNLAGEPLWERLAANRKAKSRFPLSVMYPLLRHTALWNLALKVVATRKGEQHKEVVADTPYEAGRERLQARAAYREVFFEVRDTVAAKEIPLVFTIFPMYSAIAATGGVERIEWAAAMAKEAGIRTVNFLDPLRASELPVTELYLVPQDGHASARGNSIAARFLATNLMRIDPVKGFCGSGSPNP